MAQLEHSPARPTRSAWLIDRGLAQQELAEPQCQSLPSDARWAFDEEDLGQLSCAPRLGKTPPDLLMTYQLGHYHDGEYDRWGAQTEVPEIAQAVVFQQLVHLHQSLCHINDGKRSLWNRSERSHAKNWCERMLADGQG
jgi:hypothetical protein